MKKAIPLLLIIVGLINFIPVAGILSGAAIQSAYGVELTSPDLVILMRHRALLFGLLGGFVLYSVWVPAYQKVAASLAALSMLGFLCLMALEGGYNTLLERIAIVDGVGIGCLLLCVFLKSFQAQIK